MPTVPRQPKSGGFVSYQQEVANGVTDIIDAELDADIQPLYDLCNGTLDDANINGNLQGTKIDYRKLALAGKIQASDLAVPLNLAGSSVLAPQSVTTALLAFGAPVFSVAMVGGNTAINVQPPGNEMMILEEVFTVRDVPTSGIALGIISGWMPVIVGTQTDFLGQLRLDGTAGLPTDGAILGGHVARSQGYSGEAPLTMPIVMALQNLSAGQHRLKLTAQVTQLAANVMSYQLLIVMFA
jgi:hypothetical protein